MSEEEILKLELDKQNDDSFNHCRNPDGDSTPWCIVEGGEYDYCDVPECDVSVCQSGITYFSSPFAFVYIQ